VDGVAGELDSAFHVEPPPELEGDSNLGWGRAARM
jgi:hypothetical protein